jgi:hypothetical protein
MRIVSGHNFQRLRQSAEWFREGHGFIRAEKGSILVLALAAEIRLLSTTHDDAGAKAQKPERRNHRDGTDESVAFPKPVAKLRS